MKPLKKAVFPVAGFGTRFLPATKATPKEMLPIVDTPLIQYAVKEAIDAGIEEMIFITSSNKRAIIDHFDTQFELEYRLREKKQYELLEKIDAILPKGIHCAYVNQPEQLGLGHAVLCAEPLINDEPFAILLADDLINEKGGCLSHMAQLYAAKQKSVIAVESIAPEKSRQYGVVALQKNDLHLALTGIVEKPEPSAVPSPYGVVGRYILNSKIFTHLKSISKGAGGEIQLTDAIAQLIKEESVYPYLLQGKRYDCGSKLGYLIANTEYALRDPEIGKAYREFLSTL